MRVVSYFRSLINYNLNQNPEQIARDKIDTELIRCGWIIQGKKQINILPSIGIAVKKIKTDIGPVDYDYILFVDKKPVVIIEATAMVRVTHKPIKLINSDS
jgi:type I site-specific restriction endonuclease